MPNYTSRQFDASKYSEAQNRAYAVLETVCGPEVAMAFARYYGKNIDPDDIINTARSYGLWSAQTGMRGPAAQKALLDRLGIPVQYSPEVNQNAIQQALAQGNIAALSTPFHYFTLQGYNPQTRQYDTGYSGETLRGGSRYLTYEQIAQLGRGAPQGQFITNPRDVNLPYSGSPGGGQDVNLPYSAPGGLDYNNKQQVAQYIRYAAAQRGIDPEVAVKVANSEGLNTYVGDNNSSFGPFQLHYGNVAGGGNRVGGLGDSFTKATGLDARDPKTIKEQIDFSLDAAKQTGWGPWHGAARVGVGNFTGIGTFKGDPNEYGDFSNLSSSQSSGATDFTGFPQGAAKPTGLPNILGGGGLSGVVKPTGLPQLMGGINNGMSGISNGLPPVVQMGSQYMTPMGAMSGFMKPTVAPPQVQARTWL